MTREDCKPIFLLADSRALFGDSRYCRLNSVLCESLRVSEENVTRAAYIGASNHDAVEFFDLFRAAMDTINLHESRMIRADFSAEDKSFLASADLVLLAGGRVETGWEVFTRTGMNSAIVDAYFDTAVIVGVSAGSVQLGMGWIDSACGGVSTGIGLVPYYIDVHNEKDDWIDLRRLVDNQGKVSRGFGIPSAGALICHADMSLEAVGSPVTEFEMSEEQSMKVMENLLLPIEP